MQHVEGQHFPNKRKVNGDFMASLWVGAFVGFVITLLLGLLFPGIGHLIGGFIGGFVAAIIARGGMLRGSISGFSCRDIRRNRNRNTCNHWFYRGWRSCRRVTWRAFRRPSGAGSRNCSHYPRYFWSNHINDRWIHSRVAHKIELV
jgi:hypothetical protein